MLNVTQTGVVMSKTVKRAMRVMMFGLVAMLGANAEAHFHKVGGTGYWCSFCFLLHLSEEQDLPFGAHEQFDLALKTKELEYSCRARKPEVVKTPVELRVRKDLVRGDLTREFKDDKQVGLASASVLTVVSHTALLGAHLCEDGLQADDVLIRDTDVTATFYECSPDCKPYGEIAKFNCKFPKKYNLRNTFVGALYDCKPL